MNSPWTCPVCTDLITAGGVTCTYAIVDVIASGFPSRIVTCCSETVFVGVAPRGKSPSAGISVATLMRWQKEPEFQKALRQARHAAFGQVITRLQQISGAAVATLGKMMVEPTVPPSTRVRAAEVILNQAAKGIEAEDFKARLAELERTAGTLDRDPLGE